MNRPLALALAPALALAAAPSAAQPVAPCAVDAVALRAQPGRVAAAVDAAVRVRTVDGGECAFALASVRVVDEAGADVPLLLALPLLDGHLVGGGPSPAPLAVRARLAPGEGRVLQWWLYTDPLSPDRQPARRAARVTLDLSAAGPLLIEGAPLHGAVELPQGRATLEPSLASPEGASWALPGGDPPRSALLRQHRLASLSWSLEAPAAGAPAVATLERLRDGLGRDLATALAASARGSAARQQAWDRAVDEAWAALRSTDPVTSALGAQAVAWLAGGLRPDVAGVRGASDPPSPGRREVPDSIAAAVKQSLGRPDRPWSIPEAPTLPPGNEWLARLEPPPAHDAEARAAFARLASRSAGGSPPPLAAAALSEPTPLAVPPGAAPGGGRWLVGWRDGVAHNAAPEPEPPPAAPKPAAAAGERGRWPWAALAGALVLGAGALVARALVGRAARRENTT